MNTRHKVPTSYHSQMASVSNYLPAQLVDRTTEMVGGKAMILPLSERESSLAIM